MASPSSPVVALRAVIFAVAPLAVLSACGYGGYISLETDGIGHDPGQPVRAKAYSDGHPVTVSLWNETNTTTVRCTGPRKKDTFTCPTEGLETGIWEVLATDTADSGQANVSMYVGIGLGQQYSPALFSNAHKDSGRYTADAAADVVWELTGWQPDDQVTVTFSRQSEESGVVVGTPALEVVVHADKDGNAKAVANRDLAPGWWAVDASDEYWTMSRHNGASPTMVITK